MTKKDVCSLFILNLKPITRALGRSVLPPNKGSLIRFRTIEQVQYAVNLENDQQIDIQSEIPSHILSQLANVKQAETIRKEIPAPKEETKESAPEEVIPVEEPEGTEEIETTPETKGTEEAIEVTEAVNATETDAVLKPEWYLSYEHVEQMTKKELLAWSDDIEGLKISKNKSAEEVTELVHEFLASQFDDHVE